MPKLSHTKTRAISVAITPQQTNNIKSAITPKSQSKSDRTQQNQQHQKRDRSADESRQKYDIERTSAKHR
ncbi:MAG: hypothetical protein AUK48_16140 [Oscillatoriales cyanobacterium CG2_30_44_21]|nr:MAG: hypothetical protein AUK48_16140 [Oscillatoriales cyanobacterium CG2_30_44_21]